MKKLFLLWTVALALGGWQTAALAAIVQVTLYGEMQVPDYEDPADTYLIISGPGGYDYFDYIEADIYDTDAYSVCTWANDADYAFLDMEAGGVFDIMLDPFQPCEDGIFMTFSGMPAGYTLRLTPIVYGVPGTPMDNVTYLQTSFDTDLEWETELVPMLVHFFKNTVRTDSILADGMDRVQAQTSFLTGDANAVFTGAPVWSIVGDTLGCTINATNGWIQAGTEAGEITIRVQDPNTGSFVSAALRVGAPEMIDTIGGGWCANATNALMVGLGTLPGDGAFMGSIRLRLTGPAAALATRAGLTFMESNSANALPEILNDSAGALRQVSTPECLADMTNISSTEYEIRLYWPADEGSPAGGYYAPTGQPFKIWRVQQLATDGSDNVTQFSVTEDPATAGNAKEMAITGGANIVNTFTWNFNSGDNAWTLDRNGVTQEEKIITAPSGGAWTETLNVSASGDSTVVASSMRTYETLSVTPSGGSSAVALQKVLVEDRRFGADPYGLTDNPDVATDYFYDPSTATPEGHEELLQATNSDGSWECCQYDSLGRITTLYQPWMDAAPPSVGSTPASSYRETQYSYTPVTTADLGTDPITPRTVTTSVAGASGGAQEVAESFVALSADTVDYPSLNVRQDIQAQNAGAAWDNPSNLVTTLRTYADGANVGLVQTIDHPDGTRILKTYYQSTFAPGVTNEVEEIYEGAIGESGGAGYYIPFTVTDGTHTVITTTAKVVVTNTVVSDILSGLTLANERWTGAPDYQGRFSTLTHLDGTSDYYVYNDLNTSQVTGPDGDTTVFNYDAIARPVGSTVYYSAGTTAGITLQNTLDASGNVIESSRTGTDGSSIEVVPFRAYDEAGRLLQEENALGGVTTMAIGSSANGGLQVMTTNPDGGTRIASFYCDGSPAQITGTAVDPVAYGYGVNASYGGQLYTAVTNLTSSTYPTPYALTTEWTETLVNFLGQPVMVMEPSSSSGIVAGHSYYNRFGQLGQTEDPDGVATLFAYDDQGRQVIAAQDVNANGAIDFSGTDRIGWTTNDVVYDAGLGANVNRTQSFVWDTPGSNTPKLESKMEVAATGLDAWQTTYRDVSTPLVTHAHTVYGSGGARTVTTTAPDNSYTVSTYAYSRLASATAYDSTGLQIGGTTYTYDPHGRVSAVVDARNGAATYTYNNADLVSAGTTPSPSWGVAGQTTTMYYDTLYRATNIVQPDGTSVTNVYYPNGRLEMTAGSRTYPARYAYDYAGRLSGLTTWTNFAANTGANTTTWNYDAYQGLLNQKSYADGTATGYGYTAAGRVQTRTWARAGGTGLPGAVFGQLRRTGPLPVTAKPAENSSPLSTTYVYDTAGEVTNILYNDGATPAVASLYDRLGRPVSVTMGGMTTTNVYDLGGDRLLEAYLGGPLNGLAVSNAYDADMRRTALTVWSGTTPLATNNYAYDHASRLVSVGDGGAAAAGYGYVANSPLIACVTSRHNAAPLLTATRQYDYLNRLTRTVSTPAQSAAPASYAYAYNLANQRTTNTWGDGSHWAYQYDALGQVTNALRSWSDGTPVAGEQCQYAFDTIGNRTLTRAGGDTNGLNLRAAHYAANRVNEYTQRDVSGTNDVIGVALASANVTVNGAPADRKGEYFHGVAGTNNAGGPAWLSATIGAGSANASGSLYVAQTPEVFQYDADGNLTNDGRWTYTWDAENRLVAMAVNTGAGPPYQITNVYDAAGRRIQKIVTADGVTCATNTYVYDGWNVVAVLAGASRSLSATYLWGADLSGTAGGAGGVGGLVAAAYYGAGTTNALAAYDGNGNVASLINAADGTLLASYEYGPFGELIRANGPLAQANPFRFSTKYQDLESGDLNFGCRYYNPSTGRWLNRDPMGEAGGLNLYGFVGNDPVDGVDPFGLWEDLGEAIRLPNGYIGVGGSGVETDVGGPGHRIYLNWAEVATINMDLAVQRGDMKKAEVYAQKLAKTGVSYDLLEYGAEHPEEMARRLLGISVGSIMPLPGAEGAALESELASIPAIKIPEKSIAEPLKNRALNVAVPQAGEANFIGPIQPGNAGPELFSGPEFQINPAVVEELMRLGRAKVDAFKADSGGFDFYAMASQNAAEGTVAEARGGTYLLRDAESGQVMRTGRTGDLERRAAEHGRDPVLRDFEFEPVHRTDVYNEQRGLEQLLHDTYQPPLNEIRPISPTNPKLPTYQDAAKTFLGNP